MGEVDGSRRLPIIIGMFEAQAIALEMEKVSPSRPMTHDLFKAFAKAFDFALQEVLISDLSEGVFIAKIIGQKNGQKVTVDARPSDAIAIALRFGIEMYTVDQILDEAGIVLSESEEPEEENEHELRDLSTKELKTLLEQYLSKEDYEQAARIRDEMNKRN